MTKREKLVFDITKAIGTKGQEGLHIVIDDFNLEDEAIQWCLDHSVTEKGKLIGTQLLALNEKTRSVVCSNAMNLHWISRATE